MSFADPFLVTQYLHPRAAVPDPLFPESIHPHGYLELIARLGRGSFCRGLTVDTPESRTYWTTAMKEELLVLRLGWSLNSGDLEPADLRDCMVVANSDIGDIYVTCPRFGPKIFEMPRHQTAIRVIGEHIDDLLIDYAERNRVAFSYFDPWPYCSRRCSIRLEFRSELGLDELLSKMDRRWGIDRRGTASTINLDSYQDRFIPALHAHLGFYLQNPRSGGGITVAMTLDVDAVAAATDFAEAWIVPEYSLLGPHFGGACEDHALAGA